MEQKKKHAGGRPLKFPSVEKLQAAIDAYFEATPIEEQMITGLALALDTSRDTLIDYQNKDEYSDTIKRAKLRIELAYEKRGMEKGGAFDIFRLKNMGWADKQERVIDSSVTIKGIPESISDMINPE